MSKKYRDAGAAIWSYRRAAVCHPVNVAVLTLVALTAIVISFGVTAFLLALAFRSWILTSDDEVEDDVTDRLISTVGFADEEVTDAESEDVPAEDWA